MKSEKRPNTEERGAVIVIALGIFALVLALGINFAFQSIINEKIAQNLDNKTRAELLSTTAMNRLLATISTTSELTESDLYSSGSSDKVDSNDLSDTIENISYNGNPNTAWIYIYNNANGTSDSEIIGRIAYTLCNTGCSRDDPDSMNFGGIGKLNAAACVDTGAIGTAVTEDTELATGMRPDGTNIFGRPGVNVNEIYLESLDPAFTSGSLVLISSVNAEPEGKLPAEGNWIDFATLTKSIGVDSENGEATVINRLAKKLEVSSIPDPESFWIDINNDDLISDTEEMFHRFNLSRNDWNSLTVSSFVDTSTIDDTIQFDSAYTDASMTCIPWIKNWKFPGTDTISDTMRKQIAANLIDFNDSNDSATTDDQNNPSYTGNDKTPYINEIGIELSCSTGHSGSEYLYNFTSKIGVELINMYGLSSGSADFTILEGYIKYTYWDPKNTPAEAIIDLANSVVHLTITSSGYISGWANINYNSGSWTDSVSGAGGGNLKISDVQAQIIKAKLTYNSSFADFVMPDKSDEYSEIILTFFDVAKNTGYGPDAPSIYFSYQISDPRQNLYSTDWSQAKAEIAPLYGNGGSQYGTPDSLNYFTDYSPDGINQDLEQDTNPIYLSTAYIRNAPMKSPWELGFIHRGAAWQTINLKKYNTTQGAKAKAGGNEYSDGDANILDQIKMTSNTTTLGKVNLNNPIMENNGNPLIALFNGIYVGIDMNNPTDNPGYQDSAQALNISNARTLNNAIQNEITTDNVLNKNNIYKTRAQVLINRNEFFNGSLSGISQVTDATQEEIIGKFINLTKANDKIYNPGNITVLLLSQSIKDVGGKTEPVSINGILTLKDRFEPGADIILSTAKALVMLSKNPDTNKWEIGKFEYLDQ